MIDDPEAGEDLKYMQMALELATRGWGRVAPNPLVGAVIVNNGTVVGKGFHREFGEAHAEVKAIRDAGDLANGSTLYVSLEPCAHQGKTGPCTAAILAAGIERVVFGASDPTEAGGGADFLRAHGVRVTGGVADEHARFQNRPFFRAADRERTQLPWVELKLAISIDGKVSDSEGRSKWITAEEAREEVHRLRAGADAVAIGIGTAIADDPSLTVRGVVAPRVSPTRVVFDRRLRLPTEGNLVRSAREIPVWVLCAPDPPSIERLRLEEAGVEVLETEDLPGGLELLRARGIRSLFCEGGAELAGALLDADLVDRLTLFIAPLLLGPGGQSPFDDLRSFRLESTHRWRPVRTAAFGPDTLISLER